MYFGNKLSFLWIACLLVFTGAADAQSQGLSSLIDRAGQAGIQQSQIGELQQRARANGLSDEEISAILEPVVTLSEQNLPSGHLLQKAFEGLSKHIPARRVILILNTLVDATQTAGSLVTPWVNRSVVQQSLQRESRSPESLRGEMIMGAARGIQQGISTAALETILEEVETRGILQGSGTSSVVAAVRILPDLSLNGDEEQSLSFLLRALEGGFDTEEIQKLPAALNVARQRSQLPVTGVIERVTTQLNSGVPAAEVLQNLLDGNIGGGPPGGTPPGLENNPGRGNPDPGGGPPGSGNGNGPGGNGNPGGVAAIPIPEGGTRIRTPEGGTVTRTRILETGMAHPGNSGDERMGQLAPLCFEST